MSAAGRHRLAHLDGLRGLAASLVLYQHLVEYLANAAPAGAWMRLHADWLLGHLDLGKLGVVIFFALSGYIVPFSFPAAAPRVGFVLSRVFRLYPAYWLSLAAAAWLLPTLSAANFSSGQLLANASMVQMLLKQPDVLGVYWTLLIEVLFYGLCFALYCVDGLRSARVLGSVFGVMLLLALGSAVLRNGGMQGAPVGLPLYLSVMLFGTMLRRATLEQDALARRCIAVMLPALCVVVPLAWATAYDDHSHRESVLADVSAFWLGLLIFVGVAKFKALAWRGLIYLGAISYPLYLLHPLALEIGRHLAAGQPWPLSAGTLIAATLLLTLAASHAVHRWVETPSIRWGRQLVSAFSQRWGLAGRGKGMHAS
jgi:peptidoglycan/LPS O-acetylase OafA/YrhL